ncbi:MAG: sll1863 family stress response protein [Melioribacteraceae bacterium]
MKTKYFILMTIVLITGLLLTGISFAQATKVEAAKEKVKAAKLELKDAQGESDKEYRQFKADADLKIAANEKSIAEFKVKIKTADEKFKIKYDKKVAALEQRNIELKKKISEYKYEGRDQWVIFKRGFNHDLKVVGKAIKNLFSKKD